MSKRLAVDLTSLTAAAAEPMPEATQRAAAPPPSMSTRAVKPAKALKGDDMQPSVATAMLEGLSFKVPPEFRKRFKRSAVEADMKLNELLFACYTAWEKAGKR